MKKTSKTLRIAMLLLVLCMISTVMIGGTFAKYTSEYAGQDTALVARWSFTAKGGDGDILMEDPDNNKELALFDHLYDTHINQTDGVAAPNTKYIIAPGVQDQFTVKMDYIADVDADALITITPLAGNAAVPVEYSVDGGTTWVTLANLADALADKIKLTNVGGKISASAPDAAGSFRIAAVATGSVDDINISETVMWRWAYDADAQVDHGAVGIASNDETDTNLGIASQTAASANASNRTAYGIEINVKATQVVPTT